MKKVSTPKTPKTPTLKKKDDYTHLELYLKSLSIDIDKQVMVKDLIDGFKSLERCDYVLSKGGKVLILEVEGGVFTQGRHVRPKGFINDTLKYNSLTLAGFFLIRIAGHHAAKSPVTVGEFINAYFTKSKSEFVQINNEFVKKFKLK